MVLKLLQSYWCCWSGSEVGRGAVGVGGVAVRVGQVLLESVAVQLGLVVKLLESHWC